MANQVHMFSDDLPFDELARMLMDDGLGDASTFQTRSSDSSDHEEGQENFVEDLLDPGRHDSVYESFQSAAAQPAATLTSSSLPFHAVSQQDSPRLASRHSSRAAPFAFHSGSNSQQRQSATSHSAARPATTAIRPMPSPVKSANLNTSQGVSSGQAVSSRPRQQAPSSIATPVAVRPGHVAQFLSHQEQDQRSGRSSVVNSQQGHEQYRTSSQGTTERGGPRKIRLRPVSELPDACRSLWKFPVFNAMQSRVFDRALKAGHRADEANSIYHSDDNIVVSAPTGAGKTVLFELAILRLLRNSNDSKVVYMAPTRSLCTERALDWKNKFGSSAFGCGVVELTGDSQGITSLRDVGNARIIVTTPEKWDSMTRKWHSYEKTLSKLQLLWYGIQFPLLTGETLKMIVSIDECHLVGMDGRGAVLEVIVSRMKTLGTCTRFIALSATCPNIVDVAEWLGNGPSKPCPFFEFGDEYRACRLQKIVAAYPKTSNDFQFQSMLSQKVFDLIKQHACGKAVLVFCSTRKGCVQTAEVVAKAYRASLETGQAPWKKPSHVAVKTTDKTLQSLYEVGIAVHHAGLDINDRRYVENAFVSGELNVVFATSTLAVGVNLPARMVIIKGTNQWVDGQFVPYNDLEILQMMGRAGRPQYDTHGIACIMTESALERKYEMLVNSQNLLESHLHENLIEHINSEITLETVDSLSAVMHWLRSTFLFIRLQKNPAHYALSGADMRKQSSTEDRLREICSDAIETLVHHSLVDDSDEDGTLQSTEYGRIMAKFYISNSSFIALKELPSKPNMRALLEVISGCSEFSSVRFRTGEKAVYAKHNKLVKFPVQKVATNANKVMILLQLVLQGEPLADLKTDQSNPALDVSLVWQHAPRLAKALIEILIEREEAAVRTALELLRSLSAKAWEGTPFVLRQLDGIGEKSVKALADKGIVSLQDVAKAESNRLELILNRNPPFGNKLRTQAASFPACSINLGLEAQEVKREGISLRIKVAVKLADVISKPAARKGNVRFSISVAVTTSDGLLLDFRRTTVAELLKGEKHYYVSATLVKPSQRILASAGCDEVGGSEARATVKPSIEAQHYPVPVAVGSDEANQRHEVKETVSDDIIFVDETESSLYSRESKPSAHTYRPKPPARHPDSTQAQLGEVSRSEPSSHAPIKLQNGKYACNHSCKDKRACKHLCCRDGLDKPPVKRAAAKKAIEETTTGQSSPDASQMTLKQTMPAVKRKLADLEKSEKAQPPKSKPANWNAKTPSSSVRSLGRTSASASTTTTTDRREPQFETMSDLDSSDSDTSLPSIKALTRGPQQANLQHDRKRGLEQARDGARVADPRLVKRPKINEKPTAAAIPVLSSSSKSRIQAPVVQPLHLHSTARSNSQNAVTNKSHNTLTTKTRFKAECQAALKLVSILKAAARNA